MTTVKAFLLFLAGSMAMQAAPQVPTALSKPHDYFTLRGGLDNSHLRFNLEKDPAETTNLSAEHPEIVRRLGLLIKSYILNGRSTPGPAQPNTGGNSWRQLAWMTQFAN